MSGDGLHDVVGWAAEPGGIGGDQRRSNFFTTVMYLQWERARHTDALCSLIRLISPFEMRNKELECAIWPYWGCSLLSPPTIRAYGDLFDEWRSRCRLIAEQCALSWRTHPDRPTARGLPSERASCASTAIKIPNDSCNTFLNFIHCFRKRFTLRLYILSTNPHKTRKDSHKRSQS